MILGYNVFFLSTHGSDVHAGSYNQKKKKKKKNFGLFILPQ